MSTHKHFCTTFLCILNFFCNPSCSADHMNEVHGPLVVRGPQFGNFCSEAFFKSIASFCLWSPALLHQQHALTLHDPPTFFCITVQAVEWIISDTNMTKSIYLRRKISVHGQNSSTGPIIHIVHLDRISFFGYILVSRVRIQENSPLELSKDFSGKQK
jgi:hypothetical protein